MQHVIVGTAGHIDHGKTTLVKALTGRDTDTLREEKERGISINLGFTYFDLPSGRRAGVVDVPGHERFIKNMLAGVGGIDIVLLVIAADEGIMPQTREHLNILELLDIKNGIVVVTKKDMVDSEWLDMVTEEIKNELEHSFLKDSPIIKVSSISGDGIPELVKLIDDMTRNINERDVSADFRMPVDRVFSISGFGTVITGTLISGSIKEGDNCEIYPNGVKTKIRGIQVHDKSVKVAFAGQRVAVNLAGIKVGEVERGDIISKPDVMENTMMLDCRLNYLKDAPRPLSNRDRVRVYHGTSEVLARVVLLDREAVNPGDKGFIQLRLEDVMAARRGDKYVIRSYSPMVTIGGGTILEPNPTRHKSMDKKTIEDLILKEKGNPEEVIEQIILNSSKAYPRIEDIVKASGKPSSDIEKLIEKILHSNRVIVLHGSEGDIYIHIKYLLDIKNKALDILEAFHRANPLKAGISKEEFKNKVFGPGIKQKLFDEIIEHLRKDTIDTGAAFIWKKGFNIVFDRRQEELRSKIYKTYTEAGFQPPSAIEVLKGFGREEKTAKMVFDALVDMGNIIKISEDVYLTDRYYERAKELLINHIKNSGEITAAQYRDLIGASRKYAVFILEYFDSIKLTKRIEDKRILQ